MKQGFMAIDIETTGLSPDQAQIIEIGASVIVDGEETARFSQLINPGCQLPQRIVELTGITDEMLKDAQTERSVMMEFLAFCDQATKDLCETDIILGHNVMFDYSFLKTAAARLGAAFERKGIDTLKLSRTLHADLPSKRLDAMCDYYGLERECSHRAFEDAISAAKLYKALKDKFYEEHAAEFEPEPMLYTPKKQEPMTAKQRKYLLDLTKYHKIEVPETLDEFTKSKASQYIDKIILQYGMLSR